MQSHQVQPLAEWLQDEKEGECRPCGIAVIIGDYQKALVDGGYANLAQDIADSISADDDPVLKVAQSMDKAKESVNDTLRDVLLQIDLLAQENTIKEGGADDGNIPE